MLTINVPRLNAWSVVMNNRLTTKKKRWGHWYLDETRPVSLNIDTPWRYPYEIILARCDNSKSREIWIQHMADKRWISTADIENLKCAFNDLFGKEVADDGN